MSLQIRTATDEDWPAICRADGRAFGAGYTDDDIERKRPMHDMSRFRIAVDDGSIVCIAGSYAMDVTLPGSVSVPMGGVTWVSTAVTHRRQGLMRRVLDAVHDDIDERGEPVASLYASEGGIYEHLGYGLGTQIRVLAIDTRIARIRAELVPPPGSVRFLEGDELVPTLAEIWDRFRRIRAGEIAQSEADIEFMVAERDKQDGSSSPAAYLVHRDGYAVYRTEMRWNVGQPAHELTVVEIVACTPEAHLALWHTLLSIDLVGSITSRVVPLDDPLPFLLENPRHARSTALNDGIWVNVRDIPISFGARSYRTTDRIVVEADGKRWAIDGGPDGATCRAVRTKPDLVTTHAWLSSLLYGGVQPSTLVAGRRMTASNAAVLERADMFFTTGLAPHCQSNY